MWKWETNVSDCEKDLIKWIEQGQFRAPLVIAVDTGEEIGVKGGENSTWIEKIWFSLFLSKYISSCVMQASYQVDALCRDRCRLRGNCSWRKMFHELFVASCMLFFHLEPLTNVFFCQLQKQYCTLIFLSHATKLLRQYHQVVQSDVPVVLSTLKISSHFPEWCSDKKNHRVEYPPEWCNSDADINRLPRVMPVLLLLLLSLGIRAENEVVQVCNPTHKLSNQFITNTISWWVGLSFIVVWISGE